MVATVAVYATIARTVAMVAYSATIQLLIQLQEEIGVLLYSGEEDQLTKPFH